MILVEKSKIDTLFRQIQQGDKLAFDALFADCYPRLLFFAGNFIKQPEVAEELVSELFVKIWLKRQELAAILHPQAYLYTSVKNACLNLIRSDKKRLSLLTETPADIAEIRPAIATPGLDKELIKLLDEVVEALPAQRKIIFKLIKEDGLNSGLVAELMGISKRTVENQLYKALKTIAAGISDYLGYNPQQQVAKKKLPPLCSALFIF